jgi:cytochrome c-type biogenesis protein CcmH/NrfF
MTRRELLRHAAVGALLPAVKLAQQNPPPVPGRRDSASGDRLYDPSMVQERAVATAADNDAVIKTLEHRLKCTCGCNLDIYTCRTTDFTCTYSPALHREVLELRQAGKSPDEVVAAFVAKYGEQILMAPKPVGFNLAGYLVPGTLVVLAGVVLAAVLLRRSRRARPASSEPLTAPSPTLPGNPGADERLRQALAEVED